MRSALTRSTSARAGIRRDRADQPVGPLADPAGREGIGQRFGQDRRAAGGQQHAEGGDGQQPAAVDGAHGRDSCGLRAFAAGPNSSG